MHRRRHLLAPIVLVAVVVLGWTGAPPAGAHTEVQQALPGPGQRVTGTVDELSLRFLDPVEPGVRIEVLDRTGEAVPGLGEVRQSDDGRDAEVSFDALAAGDYLVELEFMAADGDRQEESYRFTVVAGADDEDDASTTGAFVAAAVVVLVAVVAGVAVARRRRAT